MYYATVKTRTERRNWTGLNWQTDQWASRASPLVIDRRVRARSHAVTEAVRRCLL